MKSRHTGMSPMNDECWEQKGEQKVLEEKANEAYQRDTTDKIELDDNSCSGIQRTSASAQEWILENHSAERLAAQLDENRR